MVGHRHTNPPQPEQPSMKQASSHPLTLENKNCSTICQPSFTNYTNPTNQKENSWGSESQNNMDDDSNFETFLEDGESFPLSDLNALRRISKNTCEEWHQQHYKTIQHNFIDTTSCMSFLASHMMIAYFTDRPAALSADFREWEEDIFHQKNGWRINHTLYVGKNFFSIEFSEAEDWDVALSYAHGSLVGSTSIPSHGSQILTSPLATIRCFLYGSKSLFGHWC